MRIIVVMTVATKSARPMYTYVYVHDELIHIHQHLMLVCGPGLEKVMADSNLIIIVCRDLSSFAGIPYIF